MTYVRRVIAEDIGEILEMARAFHAESPVFCSMPFDAVKVQTLVGEAIRNPDWLALVAVGDHGLTGMSLVFIAPSYFSQALECMDLAYYVRPEARGTTAAIRMLQEITKWAIDSGACRLTIAPRTGIRDEQLNRFFTKAGLEYGGTMHTVALPI